MEEQNQKEKKAQSMLVATAAIISGAICLLFLIFIMSSCQFIPEIAKTLDDIETDDAITITCDKDCFQKETDVFINVEVRNKEQSPSKVLQ